MKNCKNPLRRWLALVLCLLAPAAIAELSLQQAVERALAQNPALQVFPLRLQAVAGRRQSADLSPAYTVELEAENLAGSGELSGTNNAEYTLSIGSIIELGDKRAARVALADTRYALTNAEREAAAVDLVAQVTQRFVSVLSLQQLVSLAESAHALAERTAAIVTERSNRGAAPEADQLRAEADLAQAALRLQNLRSELEAGKLALAILWGDDQPRFATVSGDLFNITEAPSFNTLFEQVADSPILEILAAEQRMAAADLELIRSQSSADVGWRLGVRRDQASGDSSLTAGISVPLFSGRRNRGNLDAAYAEQKLQAYRRDNAELRLRARLFKAWQTYRQSRASVEALRTTILPALEAAQQQTRQAYEQGRYRYTDWVAAQREYLDAKRNLITAATTALHNQALIEQLTAAPLSPEATNAH